MPFQKGNPGRPKGALNKTTRAVKEFLAELVDDTAVQASVRSRIVDGDNQSFFKALDKMVPDPPREVKVDGKMEWVLVLPKGDDVASD